MTYWPICVWPAYVARLEMGPGNKRCRREQDQLSRDEDQYQDWQMRQNKYELLSTEQVFNAVNCHNVLD